MKRLFLIPLAFAIIACNKNGENNEIKIDSTKMLRFELRLKKILSPEVVKKELEKKGKFRLMEKV